MVDYTQEIEQSISALFSNISHRLTTEDMVRIERAYLLAAEAHSEQRRKSGEPYIMHPIAVARIIAEELELGANPIIASFLHDVVEDTDYTIEQIRERFGDDVAFLVGAVTKQKKAKYQHSKQVDNFRQILDSVSFDIHALLIKLADRLHNMRTLSSMRSDKQMKIAGETDYFYAPLANRLGLYHVKSELENLSFRYRCPREYSELEQTVAKDIELKRPHIEAFIAKMEEILATKGLKARTEVRYRRPYSIWRKMQAKHCDFNHVPGRHYIRIIYPQSEIYSEKEYALQIACQTILTPLRRMATSRSMSSCCVSRVCGRRYTSPLSEWCVTRVSVVLPSRLSIMCICGSISSRLSLEQMWQSMVFSLWKV